MILANLVYLSFGTVYTQKSHQYQQPCITHVIQLPLFGIQGHSNLIRLASPRHKGRKRDLGSRFGIDTKRATDGNSYH